MKHLLLLLLFLSTQSFARDGYPKDWWKVIDESERRSWEYLPTDAGEGEVILSKRTDLGIFSNLGHTPFTFDGQKYASIEALWQMMKYPDPTDRKDSRSILFKDMMYTREQVKELYGRKSKKAGDHANGYMKENNIKWISYNHVHFNYKDLKEGSKRHYDLIYRATKNKVIQNPEIKALLLQTKGLILRSDHKQKKDSPPSYKYHEILMKIRSELLQK